MPAHPASAAFSVLVVVASFILLALLPYILSAFPQTAAAAPTFFWVNNRIWQAGAVVGLFGTVAAIYCILRPCFSTVRSSQRTPTPTALEEGVGATTNPESTSRPAKTKTTHILNAITSALLPINYFLSHHTFSLDKPFLVNLADFAMFVIDGMEGIAVIVVLVCVGAKVYQTFRPAGPEEENEEAVPSGGRTTKAVGVQEKHTSEEKV